MTSATNDLRRLLDERGVEWKAPASYDGSTKYDTIVGDYWFHEYNGGITVHGLTPEQAIDATLGAGTCCDKGTFSSWRLFTCSHCSVVFPIDAIRDAPSIGRVIPPKFCPNCGRKVVDE